MLFKQAKTRKNPFELAKPKQEKTFLQFKKGIDYGEIQVDELIYRVIVKEGSVYNYFYIGNPYKLGLCNRDGIADKNKKVMILQSKDNELYLVITPDGRNVKCGKIYTIFEYRTFLHYIPKLNEIHDINTADEIKFSIAKTLTLFKAIGAGIDGVEFEGYKLTFVEKLSNVNQQKEQQNVNITETVDLEVEDTTESSDTVDVSGFVQQDYEYESDNDDNEFDDVDIKEAT